jgi:hypothetical protein
MVAGQLTPPGIGLCASDSGCVSWNFATWVSMFLSGAFLRVCLAMRILHFMSRDGSVRTRVVCLGTLLRGCPWFSLARLSGFALQCKYVRWFVFLGAGVCDLCKSWLKRCLQPSVSTSLRRALPLSSKRSALCPQSDMFTVVLICLYGSSHRALVRELELSRKPSVGR